MPASDPTSHAVADAVLQYRQLQELSQDELASRLDKAGHRLSAAELAEIEDGSRVVGVGDLLALAFALQVVPSALLAHIPISTTGSNERIATGVPHDLGYDELRAWIDGRTALDHDSRKSWNLEQRSLLSIRSLHHEDQLRGARDELDGLGQLAEQESDSPIVERIHDRIRTSEREMMNADTALALVDLRLDTLE